MEFEQYYNTLFRTHFNQFVSQIPDESKYHDDSTRKEIITIQRERLTKKYDYLNFLSKQEYVKFITALFYTILVDMVCYKHHKTYYEKFQSLTKYPKFIGDCPGGCRFHFEPYRLFDVINYKIDHKRSLMEAAPTMQNEILSFFRDYLPEIDGELFWNQCKQNIPSFNLTEL